MLMGEKSKGLRLWDMFRVNVLKNTSAKFPKIFISFLVCG